MSTTTPLTIQLESGYTDAKGNHHRRVTFGRRLTGLDLFLIARDASSFSLVASECLLYVAALTEFGTLTPVMWHKGLLSLDEAEREEVGEAYEQFRQQSRRTHRAENLQDDSVKLAFGLRAGEVTYDTVTFGRPLLGFDELRADERRLKEAERSCFLAGRMVTALGASDTGAVREGQLDLQAFEEMDADDVFAVQAAAETWRENRYRLARLTRFARHQVEASQTEANQVEAS